MRKKKAARKYFKLVDLSPTKSSVGAGAHLIDKADAARHAAAHRALM